MIVTYAINKSTAKEILSHLEICNDGFIPPLSNKINLDVYSEKMFEKSVRFEAWKNNLLIGLVAAYLNDADNKSGFITNVSILPSYNGKGIATELMKSCIAYTQKNNFKEIKLEVSEKNSGAIHLYEKFGFMASPEKEGMISMKLILGSQEQDSINK